VSQPTLHRKTGAKSSLDGASCAEAARGVEAFGVRVADDVQDARGAPARDIGAMFDQQSPHAASPEARLDEQRIELAVPSGRARTAAKPTITPSRCATNT
jgi:hypothetical protein